MLDNSALQQLYRYALSLTAEPAAAEDLLQGALEKLIAQQEKPQQVQAYTRRIIRNQFIDQCRRAKIIAFESLQEHEPVNMDTQSLEELVVMQDWVEKLLQHLNNAEREVLYMWAVLEYSTSEIAHELKQPRGTILSRLYRIRKKLEQIKGDLEENTNASLGQDAR